MCTLVPSWRTLIAGRLELEPHCRTKKQKTVSLLGSLVFEHRLQHSHPEGTKVRTLLPGERIEEREGYRVTDVNSDSNRYIKFCTDALETNAQQQDDEDDDPQRIFDGQEITEPVTTQRYVESPDIPMFGRF